MTDEELLSLLAATFPPDPTPPSAAVLTSLHAAVEAGTAAVGPRRSARTHLPRRPRARVAAWAAGIAVLLASTSTAYAVSGATLPRPLRAAAHAVGLPVDSPALADVRVAEHRLRHALVTGDAAAITLAAHQLRQQLADLDATDARHARDTAGDLLQKAEEAVERADHSTTATDDRGAPNPAPGAPASDHREDEPPSEPPSHQPSHQGSTSSTTDSGSFGRSGHDDPPVPGGGSGDPGTSSPQEPEHRSSAESSSST